MIVKTFEIPTMCYVAYAAMDILTSSAEDPTEKPRPGEFITPEDEF